MSVGLASFQVIKGLRLRFLPRLLYPCLALERRIRYLVCRRGVDRWLYLSRLIERAPALR
jgi:hypothetical protein